MVAATVALVAVSGAAVTTAVVEHRRKAVRKPVAFAPVSPGHKRAARKSLTPAGAPATNPVLATAPPFTVVPPAAPPSKTTPLLDIEIQATSPGQPVRSIRWRVKAPSSLLINVRPASTSAQLDEEPVPSRWCCRRALVVGDYVEGRACLRVPFDDSREQCEPYGLDREVYCTNDTYGQYATGDLRRTGRLVCAGQAL
jgi:hypothetical protein